MSSGFISEAEITELRKARQEEWDRVRSADQPLEAPEEPYDPRSLYERLQEQKGKRDMEYEEAHKLKNMIKGLDDDEVEFLDLVDRTKLEEERKKNLEEEKEMRDFKAAVASLHEKSLDERLKQELKKPQTTNKNMSSGSGRNSQLRLLAGAVVKRTEKQPSGSDDTTKGSKRKLSEIEENGDVTVPKLKECSMHAVQTAETSGEKVNETKFATKTLTDVEEVLEKATKMAGGMKCIGILPGLGSYQHSSDSEASSDTDEEIEHTKYDLLGRKIEPVKTEEKS
ncbi:PSME3-interacting protein isoform X1 [Neodiprion lecontei]|uniref:PSME3-interacting protein isoform X1 n=1 Tax=Neodiprion lecontei TaxID=441921 RepID=A0A6J0B661_NEOLC|nr:PSME3-interacting protein isoform X1 [Neodiprion lecontei]